MSIWAKKKDKESCESGVARAALDGASHEELVREAHKSLAKEGRAGRIGIWLEAARNSSTQKEVPAVFHGMVLDQGSDETPQEWATLSVEPPLPEELLLQGKTVEQDLRAFPANPITGLLVGLRHALWVPIGRKEHLEGVIFAGSLGNRPISRAPVESVAAELSLALEREEEQNTARDGNTDLDAVKRFLSALASGCSADALLSNLVESCTLAAAGGPGATFAAIGPLRHAPEPSGENFSLEFLWHSGDGFWARAIQNEPLASLWRRALCGRRVMGSASEIGWTHGSVDRIVAFPLESEGQLLGTLVAGLPGGATSLATFERVELRALLAASALRRRRLEQEELRRASRQKILLECINEPLLILDESGRMAAASRGAWKLAAISASKTKGRREAEIPPLASLEEFFRSGQRERVETWLRAALDRASENHEVSMEPIRAELHNGAMVRLRLAKSTQGQATVILLESLLAGDVTEPVLHAETELREVIEWLEEGVVLFDTQDHIRAINTRFEQMAGLAPEESGQFETLEALLGRLQRHAADPARFTQRWRELARNLEGGVREEVAMAHPAPRILERSARPVLDPSGRLLGRVEIYRDLTAQRAFQSKLLQTEKLAALGQMVSGIAHELSNPLTTIVGYAHRLLARPDAPGRTEEVRQIYQEAERASTILRQLLLNARETVPERRLVSLNQIVQRTMDLQRFSLTAEKIRVEVDLDPALPFVEGDPGQLQQVLINLLGNAQQALEHQGRGGTIQLSTRRIGDRRVLLEIKDDGPGIPQAILARIFDPFFTTKPAGVGTGLGLAIVLSVVREHGGQVHVLSPPMGGAVFQIELPAATGTLQDEPQGSLLFERKNLLPDATPAARENRYTAPARQTGKGARVLVVEDEPTVARLIADVLTDEGMQAEVLMDGREALQRAARQTFDLVICDMKMPGLDGQHFYKSLKRSGNPLRDRFLFVTGDIVAVQTREFLERNRLPHVAKPFRVEELTEKVRSVLKLQALNQSTAAEEAKKSAARNG